MYIISLYFLAALKNLGSSSYELGKSGTNYVYGSFHYKINFMEWRFFGYEFSEVATKNFTNQNANAVKDDLYNALFYGSETARIMFVNSILPGTYQFACNN